jgi:glutaminase
MKRVPRNPFINAGAIVIADILVSCLKNPKEDFLAFIRLISGSPTIDYNLEVAPEKTLVLEMLL